MVGQLTDIARICQQVSLAVAAEFGVEARSGYRVMQANDGAPVTAFSVERAGAELIRWRIENGKLRYEPKWSQTDIAIADPENAPRMTVRLLKEFDADSQAPKT